MKQLEPPRKTQDSDDVFRGVRGAVAVQISFYLVVMLSRES
jgi:hypothetical protein